MRKIRKSLALLFSIVMLFGTFAIIPDNAYADRSLTKDEAVAWLKAQSEAYYDLDGSYGAQCSDFTSAYMNWLVTGNARSGTYGVYNANYYPTVAGWNTSRWEVIKNTATLVPEPGDIFITNGSMPEYGHTGVVISSTVNKATIIDQNSRGNTQNAYLHDITWGTGSYIPYYFIRYKGFTADLNAYRPNKVTLQNFKTSYNEGSTVVFTWDDSDSKATHFSLVIDQYFSDGSSKNYEMIQYANKGLTRKLPVGEYSAQIIAYNSNYFETINGWTDWLHSSYEYKRFSVTHVPVADKGVAATCTSQGKTEGSHCSVCGAVITAQSTIAALGHNYGAWTVVKEATHTEAGLERRVCERDSSHIEEREISALDTHIPSEAVVENQVTATCTDNGSYDSVIYCSECNEEISRETITVPALGHDFGEWTVVKAPTVSEAGLRQRVCSRDSAHIETEEIEKLPDPDAPTLTVDSINAKPGETVTVSVGIKNNPGIAGMVITPFYDTENLTLTKITKGNLGFAISSSKNITFDTNGDNETGNGTLVKLTFVVSDSAEAGQYDISVIVREAVNADWQNISLLAEKGSITVEEEKQVITGTCGAKATWTLLGGTLTISGTGAMTNFANKTAMPWYEYLGQIEKVVIEDGITSIGNYAFMGCSDLAEVSIGSAVKTIGVNAFSGCSKIEEVSLPASLTGISNYAFNNCSSLSLIEFNSAAAPTLGANALANTKATAIYKSSWSGFGKDMFGGKTTWLVDHAGGSCGATKYSLDRGVMTISGKGTIRGYSNGEAPWYPLRDEILTLNIGDEVTSVGNFAFIGCSNLAELNLGRSVTAINKSSFNGCSSLEKVELPEGLTSLGSYAFTNCSGLSEITFNGNTAPTIAGTAFNTVKAKAVHAGNDSWSAFNKAGFGGAIYWTDDPEEEVIGGNCGNQAAWILVDGTLTIYGQNGTKGYAKKTGVPWYEYREQITKIVVEDGITSLGNYSFMECENVTEVQLGNTLRFIGVNAFSTLKSLKTITIPASVTTINGYAFNKCSSLEKVNFEGEKPSVLASNAFNNTKVKL